MARKRVILLATSCKNGGLCPSGIDLDNHSQWIRIVADDGHAGPVQGIDIDFAQPLDIIEFEGKPCPMLKQKENWAILNNSCHKIYRIEPKLLTKIYQEYGYHGFWNNYGAYLTPEEMDRLDAPSETIMEVNDLYVYYNDYGKVKADFNWSNALYRISNISVTDTDFYGNNGACWRFPQAYLVISIPKECDWPDRNSPERRAYKFISKIFPIESN